MVQQPLFINWLIGQPTAINANMLSPNSALAPTTTAYTVQSTDYLRVIQSVAAGGTLTITIPSTLPNGFIFWVFRITNSIILSPSGGPAILSQSLGSSATVTMAVNLQLAHLIYDGSNFYLSF